LSFKATKTEDKTNIKTWINYSFIALALSVPISKAGVVFFETLIFILWLIEGNWRYKFSHYWRNPIILTLLLFVLYSAISLFWARDLLFGLEYIAKYWHFLIIPILYTSLDKKYIEYIFSAFLASILFSEIVSYGIFFEIWSYKDVTTTFPAPFMSHIEYSIYLTVAAMILLNKIFFQENQKYKIYYALFFISVSANLFMNAGRTGQLAFVVMLFALFMLNIKQKLKALLFSATLVSLVLILAFSFSPNFQARAQQAKIDISKMIEERDYRRSLSIRIGLWISGIDQITQELDFGVGIGNDMNEVAFYAQKNSINNDFEEFADHHNMFITYAIQLGEPGLLILLALFYFILTLNIKNKMYKNMNTLFILIFTIWGLTGIAFHAMMPMILFSLFIALFNGIYFLEKENP